MRGAQKRSYPEELVARVRCLYIEQGMTQEEVARTIPLGIKSVQTLMRNHGISRRPRIKRDQRGARNSSWAADRATYAATHYRVYAQRGKPSRCEECGTTDPSRRYEWASLTGNYTDIWDYKRLCASCHRRFDGVVRNLGAYAVRKELPTP